MGHVFWTCHNNIYDITGLRFFLNLVSCQQDRQIDVANLVCLALLTQTGFLVLYQQASKVAICIGMPVQSWPSMVKTKKCRKRLFRLREASKIQGAQIKSDFFYPEVF